MNPEQNQDLIGASLEHDGLLARVVAVRGDRAQLWAHGFRRWWAPVAELRERPHAAPIGREELLATMREECQHAPDRCAVCGEADETFGCSDDDGCRAPRDERQGGRA